MANKGRELMQLAKEMLKGYASSNSFNHCAASCRILSVEKGVVKAEFDVDESKTNMFGTLHGGYTATLVDIFTTMAIMTTAESQHPGVSVDLNVSYMAPAKLGETVTVEASVVKLGRSLAFTRASLYKLDATKIVATALHTKAFPRSTPE